MLSTVPDVVAGAVVVWRSTADDISVVDSNKEVRQKRQAEK